MISAVHRSTRGTLLLAFLAILRPSVGAGQSLEPLAEPGCTSIDLKHDHWAVDVVKRLEALGIVPSQFPSALVDACRVHEILQQPEPIPAWLDPMLASWHERFAAEYSPVGDDGTGKVVMASVRGSFATWSGRASPGIGEFPPDRTGAIPIDGGPQLGAFGNLAVRLLPGVWGAAEAAVTDGDPRIDRIEASLALGPATMTIGRGAVAYGYARGGAVVLSEFPRFDRLELETSRPVTPPGVLGVVGPLTMSTAFGRLSDPRHMKDPYFWGAKGTLRPHPRFSLSMTRAAMFGGRGQPVTAERVFDLLLGSLDGRGFENQLASVEVVWRLPTDDLIPITAYLEWGAEDAAGAWWDVPGRIVGLYLPTLPHLPATSLVVEYAWFDESCCSNPEWYRHWSFPGSWVVADQPLGHPLGGHGSELLVQAEGYLTDSAVRVEAGFFTRQREAENLYVPGREGRSYGLRLQSEWRVRSYLELTGSGAIEDGRGWSERSFRLGAGVFP